MDAAGAAGNDWSVLLDTTSGYSAAKPTDIDVRVDESSKRVSVRWVNGKATVGDLLSALRANAGFDERFSVSVAPCSAPLSTALVHTAAARDMLAVSAGAGRTDLAIEVRFSGYLATVDGSELMNDVLARTAVRNVADSDADTVTELVALLGITGDNSAVIVGGAPGTTVRFQMTAASVAHMPMANDAVITVAGAEALNDDPNTTATETAFRPLVAPVATGFAADVTASTALAKIDQSKNGGNQLRIAVSSSVKAR